MLKVSVVVPTYCPDDGLDRLVASLDAQTLHPSEFEIIFVDDGSPDDTLERLREIADTRENVRVEQIENSGWPCRPRNVGTDLALGEYVAYMDHDDLLYPDALRSGYAYASAHHADVLNGKEARTHDAGWAIDTYVADTPNSKGRADQHPLVPMNPHKLYRRAFLNDHNIRFREGGRVFWEDIFFNLKVSRYAEVISTLSSVPYYHWYMTPGSGSKGFLRSSPEFWSWLREVFVAIDEDLAGPTFALEHEQMVLHQYRSRVLASFNSGFAKRPGAERKMIFDACRALQQDFVPRELDQQLNASQRSRAELLRAGNLELLTALPASDPGIPGHGHVTEARWIGGQLHISATGEWSSPAGRRPAIAASGSQLVRELTPELTVALSEAARDVTSEVTGATGAIGLRERSSRVTWMVESTSTVETTTNAVGRVDFTVKVEATVNPRKAAFGKPLARGAWDVNLRCTLAGSAQQQRIATTIAPRASFNGKQTFLAYTNGEGLLTIDVDQGVRKLGHALTCATDQAALSRVGGRIHVSVPIDGFEVSADGEIATTVRVCPVTETKRGMFRSKVDTAIGDEQRIPAKVVCVAGKAALVFDLPAGWTVGAVRVAESEHLWIVR